MNKPSRSKSFIRAPRAVAKDENQEPKTKVNTKSYGLRSAESAQSSPPKVSQGDVKSLTQTFATNVTTVDGRITSVAPPTMVEKKVTQLPKLAIVKGVHRSWAETDYSR